MVPARTDDVPIWRTSLGPDEAIMQRQDRTDIGGGFHPSTMYLHAVGTCHFLKNLSIILIQRILNNGWIRSSDFIDLCLHFESRESPKTASSLISTLLNSSSTWRQSSVDSGGACCYQHTTCCIFSNKRV